MTEHHDRDDDQGDDEQRSEWPEPALEQVSTQCRHCAVGVVAVPASADEAGSW